MDPGQRPLLIALAGPNGAGKSTFYRVHLAAANLPFINADQLAHEFHLDPYLAAQMADRLRRSMVLQRLSFMFETVLSDPIGDKVQFLKDAADAGYQVVLCFIGLDSPAVSEQRVAIRRLQGEHDVPTQKLYDRFPRTLANLSRAIQSLPEVIVFDNSNLADPFRQVAHFVQGKPTSPFTNVPDWFQKIASSL